MTDTCRTGYCARPLAAGGCVPFLGWWHPGPDPDLDHTLGSHFCNSGRWGATPRVAEPEPPPTLTLTRLIGALPRLPAVPAGQLADQDAAIDARRAGPAWCAFCLVAAEYALPTTAAELMVDGPRWLDLCPPHFLDVSSHAPLWADEQVIAEWETQHRRRAG